MGFAPLCPGFPRPGGAEGGCTDIGSLDVTHNYAVGAGNPNGGPLDYIIIPGPNDVENGGVCGPQFPPPGGTRHNWDVTEFIACGPGTLTVTANSISIMPFTGASCAGGIGDLQGLLYQIPAADIDPANGCPGLLQDVMVQPSGATNAFSAGQTRTFEIYSAGTYSFASMNWCDIIGISNNTGTAEFTLEFP